MREVVAVELRPRQEERKGEMQVLCSPVSLPASAGVRDFPSNNDREGCSMPEGTKMEVVASSPAEMEAMKEQSAFRVDGFRCVLGDEQEEEGRRVSPVYPNTHAHMHCYQLLGKNRPSTLYYDNKSTKIHHLVPPPNTIYHISP